MIPVQITIRDISFSSPNLESIIRKRALKLSRFYDRIGSCKVVVEAAQKHKHRGKVYNVRVDILVPGKELVATKKCAEDVYIAVRDAFLAIGRQLEEHGRKRHGKVKTHSDVQHGRVVKLILEEGFGFIEGMDGNQYYFSITNVHYPRFQQLMIGDTVEFIAEPFNDGLQAHHVVRERQNHIAA